MSTGKAERPSPGDAKNYYLSSSARGVLTALTIFANIAKEANSIAGGAISTQRLTSVGGFIFQAQFGPADWSGDLIPYPVTMVGTSDISIGDVDSAPWTAATRLDAKAPSSRKIYVGKSNRVSATANEFLWTELKTPRPRTLRAPPGRAHRTPGRRVGRPGAAPPSCAATVRRRLLPGPSFRKRGRIARRHQTTRASPTQARPACASRMPDYVSGFAATYASRVKTLFVGANDGMLHAFDSEQRRRTVRLHPELARAAPEPAHLDRLPAPDVRRFEFGRRRGQKVGSDWKTVLVGGTGGGGQGVYALDVSDPTAFGADKVMWEFTDKDDASLGNVIGRPGDPEVQDRRDDEQVLRRRRQRRQQLCRRRPLQHDRQSGDLPLDLAAGGHGVGAEHQLLQDRAADRNDEHRLGHRQLHDAQQPRRRGDPSSTPVTCRATCGSSTSRTSCRRLDDRQTVVLRRRHDADPDVHRQGRRRQSAADHDAAVHRLRGRTGPRSSPSAPAKLPETSDNSGPFRTQTVYALLDNNTATADSSSPTAAIAGRGRLQTATANSDGSITVQRLRLGPADERQRHDQALGLVLTCNPRRRPASARSAPSRCSAPRSHSGSVIPPRRAARSAAGAVTRSTCTRQRDVHDVRRRHPGRAVRDHGRAAMR